MRKPVLGRSESSASISGVDVVWVLAHALRDTSESCHEILALTQVCSDWQGHICSIKDDLYGCILPQRFPRLRFLSSVLDISKQVMHSRKEERYRRHHEAQIFLYPPYDEMWSNLQDKPIDDPGVACMIEVLLGSKPIMVSALSAVGYEGQSTDRDNLVQLLDDMRTRERAFLKDTIENGCSDMQSGEPVPLYDTLNGHCGWDKLSITMYVSNGDEVVRVCRAFFLLALQDTYMFGNSPSAPKFMLNRNGVISISVPVDQTIGAMVKDNAIGERICVKGLKDAPQYNGEKGMVDHHIPEAGRFRVILDTGELLAVKPRNLMSMSELRDTLSIGQKQRIMDLKLSIATGGSLWQSTNETHSHGATI